MAMTCWRETTHLHDISCTRTGWSSLTHNQLLDQALSPPLGENKARLVMKTHDPFDEELAIVGNMVDPTLKGIDQTTVARALFR